MVLSPLIMLIQSAARTLPQVRQTTGTPIVPGGTFGEPLLSGLNPKYYSLVKAGKVFTAYSYYTSGSLGLYFGNAGTPAIVGVFNPFNSGVDLVILQSRLFPTYVTTIGGAPVGISYWGAPSPTGTSYVAGSFTAAALPGINNYTFQNGGYAAVPYNAGFSSLNVVPWATNFIAPAFSMGTFATSYESTNLFVDDPNGALVVAPGSILVLGNNQTTGSVSGNSPYASMTWAEIPN